MTTAEVDRLAEEFWEKMFAPFYRNTTLWTDNQVESKKQAIKAGFFGGFAAGRASMIKGTP